MPATANKDACDLLAADHIAVKHLFVEYARLAVSDGDRQGIAQRAPRQGGARLPLAACDVMSFENLNAI